MPDEATDTTIEQLRQELATLQQQLFEAQKMGSLGQLLSTTTHEFNNVLMTIINYAKLGMRNRDEASRDKALEKILAAGERAAKITNGVLGMARNRSDRLEPTDLKRLVEETLFLLERELRKHRVHLDCQLSDVPPVQAAGNQIQQVFLNLLINARQAMPEGGTLTVRLTHDGEQQTVDLMVRDTGQGIAPSNLPRIFESGFTTKQGPDASGRGGSGLGLAACRDIIKAHQGRIRVQSTVGVGTSFVIRLPVAQPVAQPVERADQRCNSWMSAGGSS